MTCSLAPFSYDTEQMPANLNVGAQTIGSLSLSHQVAPPLYPSGLSPFSASSKGIR